MAVLALGAGGMMHAQDWDDIYYDGSKSTTVKTEKPASTKVTASTPATTKVTVERFYQNDRDVDEYNRRGDYEQLAGEFGDSTYTYEGTADFETGSTFSNTQRIERFYNPDVVVLSDDADLIELYYNDTPSVNLIIGTNYATSGWGWGSPYHRYTRWYDPWYLDYYFYDPWYRPYWYGYSYGPRLWGWNYWHTGWYGWGGYYGSWYWGRPYYWDYGYRHHGGYWGHNNWHSGGHGYRPNGRQPGDHRSLLSNNHGHSTNNGQLSGRRGAHSAPGTGGTMSGRTRPNTSSGNVGTMNRTRPTTGNVTPRGSNYGGRTSSGYSGGSSRNHRSSSSSGSSSRSYTPRTGGSSHGGGYSGGGSSRGGGGGYSGGGGGGRSGGGGGGRRH